MGEAPYGGLVQKVAKAWVVQEKQVAIGQTLVQVETVFVPVAEQLFHIRWDRRVTR